MLCKLDSIQRSDFKMGPFIILNFLLSLSCDFLSAEIKWVWEWDATLIGAKLVAGVDRFSVGFDFQQFYCLCSY